MDLKQLLKEQIENGGSSYRKTATDLGIGYTDLFRFLSGERGLSIRRIQQMASKAKDRDDARMLKALAEYALGVSL